MTRAAVVTTATTNADRYYAAMRADAAYSAELERLYGRQSGDARYDARGMATVTLRELWARVETTMGELRAAMRDSNGRTEDERS